MADDYLWFEGLPFPVSGYSTEVIREASTKCVIKDEDTVILSYPKSGTNWLVEILCLIHSKGDTKWIRSVPIWERACCLETDLGYKLLNEREGPKLLFSHLPIHLFPKSLFTSKAKVLYIMRNPKDVLVSGYYFWSMSNLSKKPESLEEYFKWFMEGNVPYGSWFEHIRGWMSMTDRENVLLLSYEELQKDTRSTIEKICQFLGKKLNPEELDSVLENSSFHVMKQNKMSNFELLPEDLITKNFSMTRKGLLKMSPAVMTEPVFPQFLQLTCIWNCDPWNESTKCFKRYPTGICGDWKNHFTVAQAEAFHKVYQERMAGFPKDLFPWD